ncbi:hypothetical protein RJ639_006284 [Escallonia herrerae]|uniref:BOS complex subunit TMEM147 n=1 Tax=Escallonia herrerae TaxID=1293975 RepID=A0AA89ASF5_9ASTE|nr:hypothetical protein RJ639_006284 [Escallonia herrerae]
MTIFHFFNCAILTFGPHAVYYSATPLSEYDTLGTSVKAALVYLGTALVKLVCLATFLNVSESDNFDPYQELLKALIGFIDVAGLYFALTQLTHRNISQNHKFQAVGLGTEYIPGCTGIFDVVKKKQTQDFDSYYIRLCRDSVDYAINHKLAALFYMPEAVYLRKFQESYERRVDWHYHECGTYPGGMLTSDSSLKSVHFNLRLCHSEVRKFSGNVRCQWQWR